MIDITQETRQTAAQRRERAQEKIVQIEREIGDTDSDVAAIEASLVAIQARRQAMQVKVATLHANLNALPKTLADAEAALLLAEGTVDETAARKFVRQTRKGIADGKASLTNLLVEQEHLEASSSAEQNDLSASRSAKIERRGELVALIRALKEQMTTAWKDMQAEALDAATATVLNLRARAQEAQTELEQAEIQAVKELTNRWGMGSEAHQLCPSVGNSARIVLDAFAQYLASFAHATANDQKIPAMITIPDNTDPTRIHAQATMLRLLYIPSHEIINAINIGAEGLRHITAQLHDVESIRSLI